MRHIARVVFYKTGGIPAFWSLDPERIEVEFDDACDVSNVKEVADQRHVLSRVILKMVDRLQDEVRV